MRLKLCGVFFDMHMQQNGSPMRLNNRNKQKQNKEMKKTIMAAAMMALLCAPMADAQALHRHKHQDTVATTQKASDDEAIEAFSDTTGYDGQADDEQADDDASTYTLSSQSVNPGDYSDPFSWFNALWAVGVGGVLIAVFIMLLVLLFLAIPIVLLVLLVRYLLKKHNDYAERQDRMYYQSQSEAKTGKTFTPPYDELEWRRGIRNVSIGLGLALMFGWWGADALVGIGLLVMCYGAGQMFIARTPKRNGRKDDRDDCGGNTHGQDQQL